MKTFRCPVCCEELTKGEKTYKCKSGHSFDIAAKGYVNLLMSQVSKSKRHGDDKLMVKARRDFLNCGYYEPLRELIFDEIQDAFPNSGVLFDAGCGECWYTSYFWRRLSELDLSPNVLGIDISKNALEKADKSAKIERAVASIFNLPVADGLCDVLLNIFAPCCEQEFCRTLKTGGTLIRAVPLEKHLWELKAAVYDKPYENDIEPSELEGFVLKEKRELRYDITLGSNEEIINLFMMTPYYYKTSQRDFEKLKELETLSTKIEFGVLVYEKL